jgi:hypothetical protein
MADNLGYTPGAGATIRTAQGGISGAHMSIVKLATGGASDEGYLPASLANGLTVDVTRVQGVVICNNPTAANLKVDASGANVPVVNATATTLAVSAPAATPVAVRLSTGAAFIDTIPISCAGTVTVAGTVAISGTVAATQSGAWNIGTVATITNPVTVTGTVALSGTSPVSGTVTANQGTAAVIANAWVVKVTDGVNPAGITTVGGAFALKVDVIKQTGGGYSQVDRSAYVDGTTAVEVVGGVFNDAATSPGASQAGYARMTAFRAFHVNVRKNDGTELGIAATPFRIDPTGSTTQPVNGTVTVNQGATAWVTNVTQIGGNAIAAAPSGVLPVQNAPSGAAGGATQTPWRIHIPAPAAQTAVAIHTPAGGKTVFVEGIAVAVSVSGGGIFRIFDNTDAVGNALWAVDVTWQFLNQVLCPSRPVPLSAVNNVLRYTTGAGVSGDITVWGYDA